MNQKKAKKKSKGRIAGLPYASEIIDFAKRANLSSYERHVLLCLRASMNWKNRKCWKRGETLAEEMGCSRTTVARSIKGLKEKGILKVEKMKKRMGFENNIYSINYPWDKCIIEKHACVAEENTPIHRSAPDICATEQHACFPVRNPNKSRGTILKKTISKKKRQHQHGPVQEDDGTFSSNQKGKAGKTHNEEVENIDHNGEDFEKDFVPPLGAPPAAAQEDLERFYGMQIPLATDLTVMDKRLDLAKYTFPFRGKIATLIEKYGQDLDKPFGRWWEDQAEEFYESVILRNWNSSATEKPRMGFRKTFLRACRAGVMYRTGFHPKSAAEFEVMKKKRETRIVRIDLTAEGAKEGLIKEEARKREQRERL